MELGLEHQFFGVFIAIIINDLIQACSNDLKGIFAILAGTSILVFFLRRSLHSTSDDQNNRFFFHFLSVGAAAILVPILDYARPELFSGEGNSSLTYLFILFGAVLLWIIIFEINRNDFPTTMQNTNEWGREN